MRYTANWCFFLLVFSLSSFSIHAEGTREASPNASITINGNSTNDIAALLIDHDSYNNFAAYSNNDPNSRLYIHIADPSTECLFVGFSVGHVNGNDSNPAQLAYEYRIKDPNGNVVYGPVIVQPGDENISNWSQAFNGPAQINGSGGYVAMEVTSTDLMSAGWLTAGDYYIEFDNLTNNNEVLIDYWDLTVADCNVVPTPKIGRVWSYNWALFAVNDFGFPNRPFNGSFHVCAPDPDDIDRAFITKIDFNGSGFRPAAFNVAFNSFGVGNTGNIAADRQSRELINATQSEYAIFLNDPVDLCQTALSGSIDLLGISRCTPDDYCILFTTTKEGQVDLLLDFDGNDNVYTPGTTDVLISQQVSAAQINQPTCLDWNGLDGLGQPLPELVSTTIPVTIAFAQGIYHFPIYDAELMTNGFQISAIRPLGPDPLLYYDDSQISVSSNSGEPAVQLSGCNLPCHRWLNYTSNTVPGFGNLHTINSWWFSQLVVEEELVFLPATYVCQINGTDTLCQGEMGELFLQLDALPVNISAPQVLSQQWNGPGIIGSSTGASIEIERGGLYEVTVLWVNNLGDTCSTSCLKEVTETAICCQLEMECQSESIWLSCMDSIPPPLLTIDALIDSGILEVEDEACSNLQLNLSVMTEGSGCQGDNRKILYRYQLWDDVNDNGQVDTTETTTTCEQEYLLIDTISPEVMFTGMLDGMESGDTLYIECLAADSTWSMPMPGPEDILVFDACSDITVTMTDQTTYSDDCAHDGFLSMSRCVYHVIDECNNRDSLVFYLLLEDSSPPTIVDIAPDVTTTCVDPIPDGWSAAEDACDCAHLEVSIDTIDFICADRYTLQRIYTWSDHCGNTSMATQLIQVIESDNISIDLPPAFQDSNHLMVPCTHGTFPMWVAELDASSIVVNGGCSDWQVDYTIDLIESTDCTVGYLAKYNLRWTVTDVCGNTAEENVEITIVDNEPPTIINYPAASCQSTFDPYTIVVTDNCHIDRIEFEEVGAGINCEGRPQIRQIWHIYDGCGNYTQGEQLVELDDDTPPVFNVAPMDLQSGDTLTYTCSNFGQSGPPSDLVLSAMDNCMEVADISFEEVVLNEYNCTTNFLGQYRLIWTATDICGNRSSFELIKNVEYPKKDDIIPNDILDVVCMDELPKIQAEACANHIELVSMQLESACTPKASYQAYRITPYCGMPYIDTLWFRFHDTQPPELTAIPEVICSGDTFPIVRAWDQCSQSFFPVQISQSQKIECGLTFTEYTFRTEDNCGNTETRTMMEVPTPLAIESDIFYEGQSCIPGPNDTLTLIRPCGYAFDTSRITFTPDCPLLQLDVQVLSRSSLCDQTSFAYSELYLIHLRSACGLQNQGIVLIHYTDRFAPVLLDLPEDISISCDDSIPFPDLEAWDDCGDLTWNKTQTIDTTQMGRTIFIQHWNVTDACGNESSYERSATQFDPPDCLIELPDTILCHSRIEVIGASTSQAHPLSYQWKILHGACQIQSSSATRPDLDLMVFYGEVQLELEITDAYGCTVVCRDTFQCQSKSEIDLQRQGVPESNGFEVYPNPAEDFVYFYSGETIMELKVIDVRGRTIRTLEPRAKSGNVSLVELPKGMYLIHALKSDGSCYYRKLIRR